MRFRSNTNQMQQMIDKNFSRIRARIATSAIFYGSIVLDKEFILVLDLADKSALKQKVQIKN